MNSFEKDELIVVTNKLIYEYANVQTVDTQGVPVIRFKNNSCLSQNTTGLEVYHVPINMITMADTGHQYMGDALLKGWNGPCYHFSMSNGWNAKIVYKDNRFMLVKELHPGKLDTLIPVEHIGDIQHLLGTWFQGRYFVDANKVLTNYVDILSENAQIDRDINFILDKDNPQKRAAGYNDLCQINKTTRQNKDQVLFWMGEYNLSEYYITKSKAYLPEALKYFKELTRYGNYDHVNNKIAEIEGFLKE